MSEPEPLGETRAFLDGLAATRDARLRRTHSWKDPRPMNPAHPSAPAVNLPAMLAEFHGPLGQPYGHGSVNDSDLRIRLHIEENAELVRALAAGDRAATAQELADVVYVAYGTAHSLGIPLDAVLVAIHAANMSKFENGKPVLRDDGKLLKGRDFQPADVVRVLRERGAA